MRSEALFQVAPLLGIHSRLSTTPSAADRASLPLPSVARSAGLRGRAFERSPPRVQFPSPAVASAAVTAVALAWSGANVCVLFVAAFKRLRGTCWCPAIAAD